MFTNTKLYFFKHIHYTKTNSYRQVLLTLRVSLREENICRIIHKEIKYLFNILTTINLFLFLFSTIKTELQTQVENNGVVNGLKRS
jgi:hypothetical protein